MSLDAHYTFRQELADSVLRDLIGPTSENEVIEDPPITRYAAGILYPRRSGAVAAENDIDETDDADEVVAPDPPVALANVRYPSSMGMTFAVNGSKAASIAVYIEVARYIPIEIDAEEQNKNRAQFGNSKPRRSEEAVRWQRRPIAVQTVVLDIQSPTSRYLQLSPMDPSTNEDVEGLELFFRIRLPDVNGAVPITLVLLNRKQAGSGSSARDADSFFQPRIVATGVETKDVFVERTMLGFAGSDRDLQSYRLLYRNAREFAVGHGCSAEWTTVEGDSEHAETISTTFTPSYEVPLADSNPNIRVKALEMKYIVDASRQDIISDFHTLADGYGAWIAARQAEAVLLDPTIQTVAVEHLDDCSLALKRIRVGIDMLAADNTAWKAFLLANTAMLQQRARTVWLRAGRPTKDLEIDSEHKWRPFQLAFILLCLPGIIDPKSEDRNLADLLWFPTGGGKTEAYLGLIAFTVFLRRLRNIDGGGITALMRYTLRLLTIQQFERATLLMCCLEALRRERNDLGKEPISIGLWVGQGATPNTIDDARSALNKLRSNLEPTSGNPCQLRTCPWCGYELDHRNYYIAADKSRLIISCRRTDCLYKDALPVYVVDEDIYRYRPTLVIATADKFASLPWREQAAELFNLRTGRRSEQPPIELIIQDELHLISGPLGTLVGLYETAVDALCTRDGVRPKVIASTATIRRAGEQAVGLFNRVVRQFPPPGLDARDSYFAVEAPRTERGTRKYVGLIAPGTSHTTLLVRTYAALLQNVRDLPAPDDVKDPYWTLVGYFNSLRVLGGARMQVQDDVDDRMSLLARRSGTTQREIDDLIELTSREPSGNIPNHLKRMAVALGTDKMPVDVILATNMISVGVDIDRLGLMAVMGQPQATSEYIQSTSRVGRRWPGLVFVLFNAARSRDRSHYESFVAYHSALYRQVESTSVTPFSPRARDRALHAVLVTLARMLIGELRTNGDAVQIMTRRAELEKIKRIIIQRVQAISPDEVAATEVQLDELLNAWEQRLNQVGNLVYANFRDASRTLLVDAAYEGADRDEAFATLWSLRDVDRESNLFLIQ